MTLGDAQRRDLVAHLAQRFPGWGERAEVARAAGLADAQLTGAAQVAWGSIVAEAEQRGAVTSLLSAASRARPGDAQLSAMLVTAEAGQIAVPPADDPGAWLRGALVAGGLVVVIGLLALTGDVLGWSGAAAGTASGSESQAASVAGAISTAGVDDGAAGVPDSTAADPRAVPPPSSMDPTPVVPQAPPDVDRASPERSAETPASSSSDQPLVQPVPDRSLPCPGPAGKVVGYAYAGERSPGQQGDVWRAPRSLNVRADYPRRDNGWSSKSPVACVLPRGARVRLDQAAVAVDGGAFWVPIVGGSVLSTGG